MGMFLLVSVVMGANFPTFAAGGSDMAGKISISITDEHAAILRQAVGSGA